MTMALPKGRSVVAAEFAAIAGAGLALGFTVLDSTTSTWILVLVAAVTLGVPPRLCRLAIARSYSSCNPSAICS